MKRTIIICLCCVISLVCRGFAQSQELSTEARQFKNSLMSFLKEEGFSPSSDYSSNTISFKREGESYGIELLGSRPISINFYISGFTNKEANVLAILLACNDVNKDKYYVKAFVDDFGEEGSTTIAIEMPCHNAEEFRYVFYNCVKSLAAAKTQLQESYNKYQEEFSEDNDNSFEITGCTVCNVDKDGNIITPYGETIYSSNTQYLQPKLSINSHKTGSYTIYYKLYKPNGSLSTGSNSPSGYSSSYSLDIVSGTKEYRLPGWGLNTSGFWSAGTYKYEFYCDGTNLGYYTFTIY